MGDDPKKLKKNELVEIINNLEEENRNLKDKLEIKSARGSLKSKENRRRINSGEKSENDLTLTEDFNRKVIENSHDAILIINKKGSALFTNRRLFRIFDIKKSQSKNFQFLKFLAEKNCPKASKKIRKIFRDKIWSDSFEFTLRKDHAKERILEVNSTLLVDAGENYKLVLHIKDITETRKSEKIKNVIYEITHSSNEADSLSDFLHVVKEKLSTLINKENYYVALYNETTKKYSFPYHLDEFDDTKVLVDLNLEGSLTDMVRKTGRALFVDLKKHKELVKKGKIKKIIGKLSKVWLGAPLRVNGKFIGVIAIQDYHDEKAFDKNDLETLKIISENVSTVILRKQTEYLRQISEEKYRSYIQNSTEGIYRIEFSKLISIRLTIEEQVKLILVESFIAECNDTFAKTYGFKSADDCVGKKLIDFYSDEDYENNYNENIRFIKDGYRINDASTVEEDVDGKKIYIITNAVGIIKDGHLVSIWGTQRDITELKRAEKKLIKSEQKYKNIFNGTTDALFIHDAETGKLLDVNDSALKMYEISKEEILNINPNLLSEGSPPFGEKEAINWLSKAKEEGEQRFEWLAKTAKGELFWSEVSLKPVLLDEKEVIIALVRNINQRKKALREKEKINDILEFSSDFVGMADKSGKITYINKAGLKLLGWEKADIKKYSIKDCHPDWVKEILMKEGFPQAEKNGSWRGETAILGALKNEIPVSQIIMSHKDHNGKISYFSTVIRDLSERIRMEKELRENEKKFRSLFESASDAIFLMKSDVFIECNPRTLEIFKCTRDQILGSKPLDFSPEIQPDGRSSVESSLDKIDKAINGESQFFEWKHKKFDGTLFDAEVSLNAIELTKGTFIQAIVRDVTDRKKSELNLKTSEQRYRSLFAAEADAIILFDYQTQNFIDVNQAAIDLYGYRYEEFLELNAGDISAEPESTRSNISKMTLGEVQKVPLRFHEKKDGTIFPVEISASLFELENKMTVCSAVRDISERMEHEAALKKSEKLNRDLLEASPIGIIYLDRDGIISYENDAMKKIFGVESNYKSRLSGLNIMDIPGMSDSATKELVNKVMNGETVSGQEMLFHSHEDYSINLEFYGAPLKDENGALTGAIIMAQNIEDRKQAQTELERAQSLLLAAIEQNPAGILIADAPDVNIKIANAAALEIRGETDKPLIDIRGKNLQENWRIYYPDGKKVNYEDLPLSKAVNKGETHKNVELMIKRDNGEKRWILANAAPIRNRYGEIVAGILVFPDYTETKRIEDVLLTLVEDLSAITGSKFFRAVVKYLAQITNMEFALLGALSRDKTRVDTLAFWNEYDFGENFDFKLQDTPCQDVFKKSLAIYEKDVQKIFPEDMGLMKRGIESYFGICLHDSNEEPIGILIVFGKKPNYDSNFATTLLKILAIRCSAEIGRMNSENEVLNAKDKAERANKLKSEFLAQMSHEIRTPINTILSFSSLLKDELEEEISDDLQYGFSSIEHAGKRIIRTIDLILNMAEIQTGTYEPTFKQFDLIEDVLDNIYSEFALKANSKGLELNLSCRLRNRTIYADHYTVSQIFNNLIDNAIKYTNKGNIDITVTRNNKRQLTIDVEDTGIGMSKAYMKNLFQPFSQEDTGYTRKFEGNGLGLALVKNYCEINNAEISVKSTKGKGSVFRVTFN